jgi:hypothetical protein
LDNFIAGLDLNERFFHEIVSPVLSHYFPDLQLAAARLGYGSEVLGYDDGISTDHDWGPSFQLFLADEQFSDYAGPVDAALRRELPPTFHSYSTNFTPPNHEGTRLPAMAAGGPVNHRIEITTVAGFFQSYLAYDVIQEPRVADWLAWPQQLLLGATKGRVFRDDTGLLESIRDRLAYYPPDVWLYLLACQWGRIGQEEHLLGRAGAIGDELGSQVMAARLIHDMMSLCFLMEKRYAPYPKWFGTAFRELSCAASLTPLFQSALSANKWPEREAAMCAAYEALAGKHNDLAITDPIDPAVRQFYDRPFRVIGAERFTDAIKGAITDPAVRAVMENAGGIGSIDQYSDSTDLRSTTRLQPKLRALYQ